MKFGSLPSDQLDSLDLVLPPDHVDNKSHLQSENTGKIYVGCAKWGRDEWVGDIFPEGIKEKDYLAEYVKQFNSIELNSTFPF